MNSAMHQQLRTNMVVATVRYLSWTVVCLMLVGFLSALWTLRLSGESFVIGVTLIFCISRWIASLDDIEVAYKKFRESRDG